MAVQQLGVAGLTVESRTFYDKVLLGRNTPEYLHEGFGMKKSIPARGGKTLSLRKFQRPPAATTALTEGTPPAATNPTVSETTMSVAQYGAYMLGSDILEKQAVDPQITEWTEIFSEMMKDTRDQLVRNVINAGTQAAYGGTATVRSGVGSGSAFTMSWAEIRNARRLLKRVDAPPAVDGKYAAIIHPDVVRNLFGDTTVVNAFQHAGARTGDNPLFRGELGELLGIKFFETSAATTFSGLGQSAGFVYATLFLGKDAFAVTELSSLASEVIFHDIGTSGINDPLNQVWSLGFKTAIGTGIVDQDRILRYETNG